MLDLTKVAEVLEAAASYIEATETKQADAVKTARHAEVSKLASRIRDAVGEELPAEVLSKLAETNPEITALLSRLAGEGQVDSLGGPETTKTASSSSSLPEGEAALLNFLLS
jgi:hypothetical protein